MAKLFFLVTVAIASASACFKEMCLYSHNQLRELHVKTPPMSWDDGLAADAQKWAEHLAQISELVTDKNRGAGISENLYFNSGQRSTSCAEAVHKWYQGYKLYDYNDTATSMNYEIDDFVEVAWKMSLSVGVGITSSGSPHHKTYIVARYRCGANVLSARALELNVMKKKSGAVVPTIFELDPSLCRDSQPKKTCINLKAIGLCTAGGHILETMEKYCPVTCNLCKA